MFGNRFIESYSYCRPRSQISHHENKLLQRPFAIDLVYFSHEDNIQNPVSKTKITHYASYKICQVPDVKIVFRKLRRCFVKRLMNQLMDQI